MPYTNSKGAFPNQPIIRGERPDTTDKNFTITDNLVDDIVIFHFQKSRTTYLVYHYLCRLTSPSVDWKWYPSTISKLYGISDRSIRDAFHTLVDEGFLTLETSEDDVNPVYSFHRLAPTIAAEVERKRREQLNR